MLCRQEKISIEKTEINTWVFDYEHEKMIKRVVSYVPGLYKIFDEIITGFRMHPGGAQSYFNVIPDLACFAMR